MVKNASRGEVDSVDGRAGLILQVHTQQDEERGGGEDDRAELKRHQPDFEAGQQGDDRQHIERDESNPVHCT